MSVRVCRVRMEAVATTTSMATTVVVSQMSTQAATVRQVLRILNQKSCLSNSDTDYVILLHHEFHWIITDHKIKWCVNLSKLKLCLKSLTIDHCLFARS